MSGKPLSTLRTGLLAIDLQDKLIPSIDPERRPLILKSARTLIASSRILGLPLVITEQYPQGLGATSSELGLREVGLGEMVRHSKTEFSAWANAEIKSVLEQHHQAGVEAWIVMGLETHICVFQTVRDLVEQGAEVHVMEDGTGSRTNHNHVSGLGLMDTQGACISNSETALFDLLKSAGSPEFKAISKLIR